MDQRLSPGLYIVATPIGNLGDITLRAAETLRGVSAVACEDTRITGRLMQHLGLKQRLIRYDDHADEAARERLLAMMAAEPVALVSDAGTPLISDPGYRLVREARERGIAVTSLPGPCAAVMGITCRACRRIAFSLLAFCRPRRRRAAMCWASWHRCPRLWCFTKPRRV
jgi:16S rRNA (cytidine1402-2'-O)-methyltransferase